MDTLTRTERSKQMSLIRSKNTKPELRVRRLVHALGFRYRLHRHDLPGKPDLVFPLQRKLIFVNGCFFHRHKGCRSTRLPKSRLDYWAPKFKQTMRRDARNYTALSEMGWQWMIVWECETKNEKLVAAKVMDFLKGPNGCENARGFTTDDGRLLRVAERGTDYRKSKLTTNEQFTVVSMFSGCGGMDLGFRGGFEALGRFYDPLPFRVTWSNDNNEAACRTYKMNLGQNIIHDDVWNVLNTLPGQADVLIGGFPCQDISINGKRAGVNGKRSGLYKAMVEAIKKVKPRVFVAENVKGLLMKYNAQSLRQVIEDYQALGYDITYKLYQAANYGIPQTRERVFIVGTSRKAGPFSPPPEECHGATWMTAEEAIKDLESLEEAPSINHVWSLANVSPDQGNRRLDPNRPAYTIRAECHGNIQFHYRLPRRISMREAARFQSFPDDFIFVSKLRETERQVGNAVPPVLAWHIARRILECLR